MPKFLLPIRSGRHRCAAIGLYRVLLTQCNALPALPVEERFSLANVVRTRFKQTRHVQSTRLLQRAFQAGYDALDQLDAAIAGSHASTDYLLSLLARAPAHLKDTPHTRLPKPLRKEMVKAKRRAAAAEAKAQMSDKPTRSFFDRPLPLDQLSGKRHIPILANASGIPFLRIKKPQPFALSAYLDKRIKTRQKRSDSMAKLREALGLARQEDAWDRLIGGHKEVEQEGDDGVRWTWAPTMAIRELEQYLEEDKRKRQEMAEKMQAMVDRETEIAEREMGVAELERVARETEVGGGATPEPNIDLAEHEDTEKHAVQESAPATEAMEKLLLKVDAQARVG